MAQSIKVGSLVKYKDHEGNLNGGTVITFREWICTYQYIRR